MTNFNPKASTRSEFAQPQKPQVEAEEVDDEIFTPRREERRRPVDEEEAPQKKGGFFSSFRNSSDEAEEEDYDDIDFDMPAIARRHRRD